MATDDLELLRLYIDDVKTSGSEEPFLSDTKLQSLLDAEGSVEGAAGKAWRIKAAQVSSWYLTNVDGSFLSRDQVFEHCIKMAEHYEHLSGGSDVMVNVGLVGPNAPSEDSSSEF